MFHARATDFIAFPHIVNWQPQPEHVDSARRRRGDVIPLVVQPTGDDIERIAFFAPASLQCAPMDHSVHSQTFLAIDEPAPYTILNTDSTRPILLVCDHASKRLPRAVGDLGLDVSVRNSHLAVDIGAADVTRRLAGLLGVTAVLAEYSRLVVDLNRELSREDAFLEFGDGTAIPGNRGLSPADKQVRIDSVYHPYHDTVDAQIRRLAANTAPCFISIHSFTPVMDGVSRPWEVGVLWDADQPTADIFMNGLRDAGFIVGDNQPYSGKRPPGFTIDHHAKSAGLRHVAIEMRQDITGTPAGVDRFVNALQPIVANLPQAF